MKWRRYALALIVICLGTFVMMAGLGVTQSADNTASDYKKSDDITLVSTQSGDINSYTSNNSTRWNTTASTPHFGTTYLKNGKMLTAFGSEGRTSQCGKYSAPCDVTGFQIIDGNKTVVDEWSYPVRDLRNSEVHDVEPLPSGGYLVAGMEYERVFIVQQGEITWQWNANTTYDAPADPTTQDWLHINDVDRLKNGTYMVSVRNKNQILILDKEKGVVDVINEEGDPELIRAQHNPQYLSEGVILVADSGNDRVVEIHKMDSGRWQIGWSVSKAGGKKFDWPRDADRLPNGNTLITDTRNNRVVEINRSGSTVWSRDKHTWPYEADRIPPGEQVGAPVIGNPNGVKDVSSGHVPALSYIRAGVESIIDLPVWFNEWYLLAFSFQVTGIIVGLGLVLRNPRP